MNNTEIQIISERKYRDTNLYKVNVQITNNDEYEYKSFIVKYLNLMSSNGNVNPVLIEPFINKKFKNDELHTANFIQLNGGFISLYFDEYDFDLSKCRKHTFPEIKSWITNLVKGISALHSKRIIHGNICPKNVCVKDGYAKLREFSNSAIMLGNSNQHFIQKMFQENYRSLEVWSTSEWGLSADIWALGCTIFYMVYHTDLFSKQNSKKEYINQLENWQLESQISELTLPEEWNLENYIEINRLIISMLNPNPSKRPSIFEILNDSFFQGKTILGSSPQSICSYGFLNECISINQRKFTINDFRNDILKDNILNYLRIVVPDSELALMIMCIYDELSNSPTLDKKLLNNIITISYLLTYRTIPPFLTIKRDTAVDILLFSNSIDFNYLNFSRFFGIMFK